MIQQIQLNLTPICIIQVKTGAMPVNAPRCTILRIIRYTSYSLTDQISLLDEKLQFILGLRYQDVDVKNPFKNTEYKSNKVSPSLGVVVKNLGVKIFLYMQVMLKVLSQRQYCNSTVLDANNGKNFCTFQTKTI